jgi:GT2 family glycosyltransferase
VLSVIVPVRDGARLLRESLPPLLAALSADASLVVVDDGSQDGSGDVARALGIRVIRLDVSRGPAAARNLGARDAIGDVLVFLDADVRVHGETLDHLLAPFGDAAVAATFGSYDDSPSSRTAVSLYKNLAHHFVHQRSREEAATFWAGCGAMRRAVFQALGGFDESYRRPSIEDVELGYRLRAAGHRIRLVREAQVTHLKRWRLGSWLRSDLFDRAIPWARLVRAGRALPSDLNFTPRDRAASALVALGWLAAAGALLQPRLFVVAAILFLAATWLDAPFLRFAAARVSLPFACAAAVFQLVHRTLALVGLALGWAWPVARRRAANLRSETVNGGSS